MDVSLVVVELATVTVTAVIELETVSRVGETVVIEVTVVEMVYVVEGASAVIVSGGTKPDRQAQALVYAARLEHGDA
ncbi:hypothetical protein AA313_de0205125 [Arthrobotrys entomopaga]|nr:hypothetical protein AA313_de0205125 [Arthrobotrys entomopaga]